MDHAYTASTVEMDHTGFESLQDQILNKKTDSNAPTDIRDQKQESKEVKKETSPVKKYFFKKGDQSLELDDDFEIEFMADKRPTKLTLRELKDRAAGDIAVKNRMHSLAEERKKIQSTFKEFAAMAKSDPLGALEFISGRAKEADSDFEYNNYIEKLAEQAEKLGQMDEKDRKSLQLEKQLKKAEQDLSHKERQASVVVRKQEMLAEYPGIGDQEFGQMVDAVLSNEELLEGLEDEHDVMNRVEDLIQETLTQRDIMSVIEEINPDHLGDNDLIFSLSDQIRQNPDFDEEDIRYIISELIGQKEKVLVPRRNVQREKDVKTLSSKARDGNSINSIRERSMTTFDVLKQKLLENKEKNSRTPLYKR